MPLTRSKRVCEEPLLTLSAVKVPKRRRIANTVANVLLDRQDEGSQDGSHKVSSQLNALLVENDNIVRETESSPQHQEITFEETEEEDVLNISDQNENEIDVSAELESIDGDDQFAFEEAVQEEQSK